MSDGPIIPSPGRVRSRNDMGRYIAGTCIRIESRLTQQLRQLREGVAVAALTPLVRPSTSIARTTRREMALQWQKRMKGRGCTL
jgi:hypothetical protein